MLLHPFTSTVYLNRRTRLFQAYPSGPRTQPDGPQQAATAAQRRDWLCALGQALCNEAVSVKALKMHIRSSHQNMSDGECRQVISMARTALAVHRPSAVSNMLYYLCRRSPALIGHVSQLGRQIVETNLQRASPNTRAKNIILLTDLFLFGLASNHHEFMTWLLLLIFQREPISREHCFQHQFILFYWLHYLDALVQPSILIQRTRAKLLQSLNAYLNEFSQLEMKKLKSCMEDQLRQLQRLYINHKCDEKHAEVVTAAQMYISAVDQYDKYRELLLKLLGSARLSLYETYNPVQHYETLIKIVEVQYPPQLHKPDPTASDSQSSPRAHLLQHVFHSCSHYPNRLHLPAQALYSRQLPSTAPLAHSFIQLIPDEFESRLINCGSVEGGDELVLEFLGNYNKHGNRVKLVETVLKGCDRNNIGYMVRVLAGVGAVQGQEFTELIRDKLAELRPSAGGRLDRGQYGRYSSPVIEMIRFGILPADAYLLGLLEQIKVMNGEQIESQGSTLDQKQNKTVKTLTLNELISLIEKLGRQVYYSQLQAHIIFNEVIDKIYQHIRTRSVAYDFELVNRFNGLVSYLQNVEATAENPAKHNIIPIDELTNDKRFNHTLRSLQNQLKRSQHTESALQCICSRLVNSISSENYILSYLYAELVNKLNRPQLDDLMAGKSMDQIVSNLRQGNYQGAALWSRFLGELHREGVIKQAKLLAFLRVVLRDWFQSSPGGVVKVVCALVDACGDYMKKTRKKEEIHDSMLFVFQVKAEIIKNEGLNGSIVELQAADVFENYHPGFKFLAKPQDCQAVLRSKHFSHNIEKSLDQFYKQYEAQTTKPPAPYEEQEQYNPKQPIYVDKNKAKYAPKVQETPLRPKYAQKKVDDFSYYNSEPNQGNTTAQSKIISEESAEQRRTEEPAPIKKIKIIGRRRDGAKDLLKVERAVNLI